MDEILSTASVEHKILLMEKIIEPILTTKSLTGYFRILMSYKKKKRKDQMKNLFLPFLYPEPGSNRHSIAATGV